MLTCETVYSRWWKAQCISMSILFSIAFLITSRTWMMSARTLTITCVAIIRSINKQTH